MFGGKVGNVDDSAAKKIPGVRQIVVLDDLVAVVGDHMWAAKKGLDALDDRLGRGPERRGQFEGRSGTDLRAASEKDGVVAKSEGDIAKGLASRREARRGLRDAVPRPRDDGADELHRACASRIPAKSGPARR